MEVPEWHTQCHFSVALFGKRPCNCRRRLWRLCVPLFLLVQLISLQSARAEDQGPRHHETTTKTWTTTECAAATLPTPWSCELRVSATRASQDGFVSARSHSVITYVLLTQRRSTRIMADTALFDTECRGIRHWCETWNVAEHDRRTWAQTGTLITERWNKSVWSYYTLSSGACAGSNGRAGGGG